MHHVRMVTCPVRRRLVMTLYKLWKKPPASFAFRNNVDNS